MPHAIAIATTLAIAAAGSLTAATLYANWAAILRAMTMGGR